MKKYLSFILYSVLILSGTFTYAQTTPTPAPTTNREYTVLAPLPGTTKNCTGTGATEQCTADLNSYLSGFLGLAIGVGAMIAMIILAWYGFQYAVSDSASVKMQHKDKIFEILGGFLLIVSAYAIVRTINPEILPENGFRIDISTPITQGGGITSGGGSVQNYPIVGYNIGPYATASNHEAVVSQTYNQLRNSVGTVSAASIESTMNRIAPGTPLTGQMILDASRRYNVDPILLMSMMQVDSSYGTKGKGANTRNPGNVGNMDDGRTRTFATWQEGVNAVADWLNRHRI